MSAFPRPIRSTGRKKAVRAIALLTAAAIALPAGPVQAQARKGGGGLPVIRDAEIEQLMRDYTAPILRAAGLGKHNIQVVLINNKAFNAFVADGRRIFVNTGALADSETSRLVGGAV